MTDSSQTREKQDMKTKTLNKEKMILNIRGLSKGDRAYCGPFGTVQCTKAASESKTGKRMFKVSSSSKLTNRGNWTFKALKEAIGA
jgi:hypothetical protein